MAQPTNIVNGDIPDATKLMLWFNWFVAGRGIKKDTYSNLKILANTEPTYCLIGWATDIQQLMFYTGDNTIGDNGFIVIGGV